VNDAEENEFSSFWDQKSAIDEISIQVFSG